MNLLFKALAENVWQISRSAKGLLMVTTDLNGFSLANCRRFAKFAKLSTRQTFPLYGMLTDVNSSVLKVCFDCDWMLENCTRNEIISLMDNIAAVMYFLFT